MPNITIPFSLVLTVIGTLAAVIIALWLELKNAQKINLKMTENFIAATSKFRETIESLRLTIENNTKAILTVEDLWKGILASRFLKRKE